MLLSNLPAGTEWRVLTGLISKQHLPPVLLRFSAIVWSFASVLYQALYVVPLRVDTVFDESPFRAFDEEAQLFR